MKESKERTVAHIIMIAALPAAGDLLETTRSAGKIIALGNKPII
jgi:hypothetical protein